MGAPNSYKFDYISILSIKQIQGTIQVLLGHGDLETTAKYLHLSAKHLHAVVNPLESITLSDVKDIHHGFRRKNNT